jgi:hypothetical protein
MGGGLRPANDIQRHGLMRVAAKAADLKIEISGIDQGAPGNVTSITYNFICAGILLSVSCTVQPHRQE